MACPIDINAFLWKRIRNLRQTIEKLQDLQIIEFSTDADQSALEALAFLAGKLQDAVDDLLAASGTPLDRPRGL